MATLTGHNVRRTRIASRRRTPALALLMGALAFLPSPAQAEEAGPVAKAPSLSTPLADLQVGEPITQDGVQIVPIVQSVAPATLPVTFGLESSKLRVKTIADERRETHVMATNGGTRAAFLAGGTLFSAGPFEHALRHSVMIPAGETLALEAPRLSQMLDDEAAEDPVLLGVIDAMAPTYLRQDLLEGLDAKRLERFMTNVRPLADSEAPSDQSLARLLGSKAVTARCPTCVAEAGPLAPQLRNGKVVGYVLVVDGRAQVIEVFASNAMMQAHLPAALRSTGLLVAALALRADDVGLKPDTNETPEYVAGKAQKAAEDTLKSLKRFADTADIIELRIVEKLPLALLRIDSRSTQGSALMLEHRLLHAVLYPHDPYRGALFDEPLDNTKGAGSGSADASRGELERRAARGTLTPAERRRIERINPGTPATPEVR